jgi:hypothetical protein
MSFLRRVFGGGGPGEASGPGRAPSDPAEAVAEDAEHERALLLEEARRLSDDLVARQMRYADRSWTPPAQGGSRRADDTENNE